MITLNQDEKIHLFKRRHRIVLILELAPAFLFFFLIIIGMLFLIFSSPLSWPKIFSSFVPALAQFNLSYLLLFFLSFSILILWLVMSLIFMNYYLDCWIVTNQRTAYFELKGLFSRVFCSVPHDKIQDISIDVHGILPTIFRFGDVQVQTAGGFREFVCRQIPDPYETKEIMFKAKREFLMQNQNSGQTP